MFLPVLLVRDYGVWGYVVFAIPNCLGAALSGVAMGSASRAEWFVRTHGIAARWFSLVTIAFQMFFAGWMLTVFPVGWALPAALAWLGLAFAVRRGATPAVLIAMAVAALAVTGTAFAAGILSGEFEFPRYVRPIDAHLGSLAPICAFGFALCPYLDLTFWKARSALPGSRGGAAFVLGFMVLFPVCVLYTLAYAARLGDAEEFEALRTATSVPVLLLGAHLFLQLSVTVHFHSQAAGSAASEAHRAAAGFTDRAAGKAVLLTLPLICGGLSGLGPSYHDMSSGEVIYRVFMGAYGLIFPAYVWLCVMPSWRLRGRPCRSDRIVWLWSCLIAAPMFWIGFVERREVWLIPGLAVVILARFFVGRSRPISDRGSEEPPEPSGAPVPVHSGPPTRGAHATPERGPPESLDSP